VHSILCLSLSDLPDLDNFTTCTHTIRGIFSNTHTLDNEEHVHDQQLRPGLHWNYWHAFLRIRTARQSTHIDPRYENEDWLYAPLLLFLSYY